LLTESVSPILGWPLDALFRTTTAVSFESAETFRVMVPPLTDFVSVAVRLPV
jgi:hypothetical protein